MMVLNTSNSPVFESSDRDNKSANRFPDSGLLLKCNTAEPCLKLSVMIPVLTVVENITVLVGAHAERGGENSQPSFN